MRSIMSDGNDCISTKIIEFIARECLKTDIPGGLKADTSLIDSGIIDSLSIFRIIGFLEKEHGIRILPEDVAVEHFESVDSLTAFVSRKCMKG